MKVKALLFILFLVIVVSLLFVRLETKEGLTEHASVPNDIYLTWHTKKLPPKMEENVEYIKKTNPDCVVHLYDDDDCYNFIKKHFDKSVVDAYDCIMPGAYKADLWRYCVLYQNGGIYMDIKLRPVNGFRLNTLLDKTHYVLDRPHYRTRANLKDELEIVNKPDPVKYYHSISDSNVWKTYVGLYNALIVSYPKNPFMLKCIHTVVENCKNRSYGFNPLYPTGPGMMGDLFFQNTAEYEDVDLFNSINGNYVFNKDGIILRHYDEYRKEQYKNTKRPYYYNLWYQHQIYKV